MDVALTKNAHGINNSNKYLNDWLIYLFVSFKSLFAMDLDIDGSRVADSAIKIK